MTRVWAVSICCLLATLENRPLGAQALCAVRESGVSIPRTGVSAIQLIPTVGVRADGSRGQIDNSAVDGAASAWNAVCAASLNPVLSRAGTSQFQVPIIFYSGSLDGTIPGANSCIQGRCACTALSVSPAGEIRGATVFVFAKQGNGASCATSAANVIAHELGHVNGLGDVSPTSCGSRIMGSVSGAITGEECAVIDRNFWTPLEGSDPGHEEGPCGT
jgi:hypothetical protein